jgi:hypothetical protein
MIAGDDADAASEGDRNSPTISHIIVREYRSHRNSTSVLGREKCRDVT